MKLQRLRTMGPAELVFRGRQELTKRLERIGVIGNSSSPPGFFLNEFLFDKVSDTTFDRDREHNLREAGRALYDRFWESAAAHFFEGAADVQRGAVLEGLMSDVREQVIAFADEVSGGRFNLLGYTRLFFGDPVDWHLDPVSGRQAPRVHWSRINPLDADMVGDHKVIWELNRHQWFVGLGQAYRLTGDERYAEIFAARIRAWMRANPRGTGINWASSLEVALRMISWCWALFLFRGSMALSPELFVEMLEWIRAQAAHVERYLSYYFSPNTHLTGEALGLFYVGVLFPELSEAEHWRTLGTRILVEQIEQQVLPDGVYLEQSTCYQRYTAETYLHFLILADRNGIAVPATVGERVQRMLDFLLTVRRPDGSMPQIGDADGGALLSLVRRAPDDFRGVFAVAAAFFGRPDYAWAAGAPAPEVFWLLGTTGCKIFDSLRAVPPSSTPSRLFSDGGYAVMRSGWDKRAHQLIFDIGPLGCPFTSGHGHADLLGIQCAVFGDPYLIDTGTYCYTADAGWRDYFRGSAAHSTVTVDGLDQASPAGPFKWHRQPRARLRRWVSTDAFDLADADHDAYHRLPDPVTHRRRVFFAKPRYWVVVDELDGKAEHRIDLRFQFAPMEVTLGPDGWALARNAQGRECRILVVATAPLTAKLVAGESDPIQGWAAPDYGRREPTPMLMYSSVAQLPLRIVTLLFPVANVMDVPPVAVASMENRRIDLVFADAIETLYIEEHRIVADRERLDVFESADATGA